MRVWRNVKTMEEVVKVANLLYENDIKYCMEFNDNHGFHDSATIVVTSRKKDKLEFCFNNGFKKDKN